MLQQPLPAELCFPAPPTISTPPAAGAGDAEVRAFLQQICAWRLAVMAWIAPPDQTEHRQQDGLTERACKALATFLATEWSDPMKQYAAQSPYNIGAFPAVALDPAGTAPSDAAAALLRWRAGFVDYLDDVWDVIGDPFLTLDECEAMRGFLTPPDSQFRCRLCLQTFPTEQLLPDRHPCALLVQVRAKWPALPPALARMAEEARETETAASPATVSPTEIKPAQRKWWQFWK